MKMSKNHISGENFENMAIKEVDITFLLLMIQK